MRAPSPRPDERARRAQRRGLTAIDGAIVLIAVLVVVQMWVLTAALESFLAGHREAALPGAVTSGALLAVCLLLYRFVRRVDRESRR